MRPLLVLAAIAAAFIASSARPAAARDHMWIVSPSAGLPFTKAVAERVATALGRPAPVVDYAEPTLGFKLLCDGTGAEYPDAVAATRHMTKAELEACQSHGIGEIVEIPVGLDLLVIAQSKAGPSMRLTLAQLFLAFSRQYPDEYGDIDFNSRKAWSEVDESLPATAIEVRMLQHFSGAGEALEELMLQKGARKVPSIARFYAKARVPRVVWTMRRDAPFVVTHESEEVIARELVRHPNAVGVVEFRTLQANSATLRAVEIEGSEPTLENAYAGRYPGTRTLYLYFRRADLGTVPGLDKLGAEYVSSAALGADGYLLKMGFAPLPMDAMIKTMALTKAMPPVQRDMLPD
jgi:phosphate transport system substrate-binding protein